MLSSRRALNCGLCVLGGAGVLAGIVLETHALFLCGMGVGILGYMGVRRELRETLKRNEELEDGPGPD
jgi:hypothetical protein